MLTRRTWSIGLVVLLAAIVPLCWCRVVLGPQLDPWLVSIMLVLSVGYWWMAAQRLVKLRRWPVALLAAVVLGLVSPLACVLVAQAAALLWVPFLADSTSVPPTMGMLLGAPMHLARAWWLFFPVGLAMGLVAFAITRLPHGSHALPSAGSPAASPSSIA